MIAVDARFAGGAIFVARDEHLEHQIVRLELPGHAVTLFASEARTLASALTSAASEAESAQPLRRRDTVDEHLRELDNI